MYVKNHYFERMKQKEQNKENIKNVFFFFEKKKPK